MDGVDEQKRGIWTRKEKKKKSLMGKVNGGLKKTTEGRTPPTRGACHIRKEIEDDTGK